MRMRDRLIPICALLERNWRSRVYYQTEFEMKISAQLARELIERTSSPSNTLRFDLALAQVQFLASQLLSEEAVLDASNLNFQLHFFALASSTPKVTRLIEEALNNPPVCKLTWAILKQSEDDDDNWLEIDFSDRQRVVVSAIKVNPANEATKTEKMSIPGTLATPLRGSLVRLEIAGYDTLQRFIQDARRLTRSKPVCRWIDNQRLDINLDRVPA